MYRDRLEEDVRNWFYKKPINEATGESGVRGSYVGPLVPGVRKFDKTSMEPFTIPISKYNDAMLGYDSYDGSMDETKKQIKKIETSANKVSNFLKKHPNLTSSDEDGNNINQTPGRKLKMVPVNEWVEITESTTIKDFGYNKDTEELFDSMYRILSERLKTKLGL